MLRVMFNSLRIAPNGAEGLRGPKERDQEFRIIGERSQVPAGQQQIGLESAVGCVVQKLAVLILATRAEADHRPAVALEVGTQPGQHLDSGTWGKERHDVAGPR